MSDDRPLVDDVLDHVFFAPVGFAVGLYRSVTKAIGNKKDFVEHSRDIATDIARTVGSAVIGQVNGVVTKVTETSKDLSHRLVDVVAKESETPKAILDSPIAPKELDDEAFFDQAAFPVADYDDLPTVLIIAKLESLDRNDRLIVRSYELAHRKRRTVLGRLDQLDEQEND